MTKESRSDRCAGWLRDLIKALGLGLLFSATCFVLLFLGGVLFGAAGNRIPNGMEAAKDGLMAVAALGMFLLAGMILIKGKKSEAPVNDGWRRHFRKAGYKSVLAMICVAVIIAASLADYLLLCM